MNILYGKTFGLGNAVMAVPALRALRMLHPEAQIDLLIGSTHDDVGSYDVLCHLVKDCVDNILIDTGKIDLRSYPYDVAIMAIPFDGRWRTGEHFLAKRVIDGRTRPDPSTVGLVSWEKHEVEYQMDNIRELGYAGVTPPCSFYGDVPGDRKHVYLGIGFKKDASNFWSEKHWGNENYAELVNLILDNHPDVYVHSTGDVLDWKMVLGPIGSMVKDLTRFIPEVTSIPRALDVVASCGVYVGNDTGMMHVAASRNMDVIGVFRLDPKSITKNHPWCSDWKALDGRLCGPKDVYDVVKQHLQA